MKFKAINEYIQIKYHMKKNYLFTVILAIIGLNLNAQSPNWLWAKSVGGSSDDQAISISTDSFGNEYVVGYFESPTLNFGSVTLTNSNTNGSRDIFIVKYDANGTVIWAKSAVGSSNDEAKFIANDSNGNSYVTGYFNSSTITFGSIVLTSSGSYDMFVAKYDNLGNVIWAKRAGGNASDFAESVATDASGNVYVAGKFASLTMVFNSTTLTNVGSDDTFLVKYDTTGNVLWAKSAGGNSSDNIWSMTCGPSGDVYAVGGFGSTTIAFDSITLTKIGSGAMFIVKYDTNGNAVWAKSAGSASDNAAYSVSVDINGNSYVTGYFQFNSIDFGSTTLTNAGDYDVFIAKYDVSGNVLWAKGFGGSSGELSFSVKAEVSGVIVAGSFGSSAITIGSTTLTNPGSYSVFIAKYDDSGNVLWAKSVGGPNNVEGLSIATDAFDNIYLVGDFNSPTIAFGSSTLTNTGIYDIFIAKLVDDVWPGDVDNNFVVNNNDILSLGLYYGQTGPSRTNVSNIWQAESSANWSITGSNGVNIKHANCDGDGTIGADDTLAINLNFNLTHSTIAFNSFDNERLTAPDIYFITSSNNYNAGEWVDVEIWLGDSTVPVNDLYGIAFNINYSSSLVKPGTESISYPNSWIGTPGTNAIKISKVDALANTAYGALTRINHTNASGFGKIADFKFQVKATVAATSTFNFSISNYVANDSTGLLRLFNTIDDSITINHGSVGITELNTISEITIFPNPFTSQATITFNEEQKNSIIKIMDVLGKEIEAIHFTGKQLIIERGIMENGIYFVQVIEENKNVENRKIIIQ